MSSKSASKIIQNRLEKEVLNEGENTLKSNICNEDVKIDEVSSTPLPAWSDEDDEIFENPDIQFPKSSEKLKKRFEDIFSSPDWSKESVLEKNRLDETNLETEKFGGHLLEKRNILRSRILSINKVANLTNDCTTSSTLSGLEFHPTATIALVADTSGLVNLVKVDGHSNSKIHNVRFEDYRITCAHFTADGNQFIVSSPVKRYFYFYDLQTGVESRMPIHQAAGKLNLSKFYLSPDGNFFVISDFDGMIHFYTVRGKEWITSVKMNNRMLSLSFSKDSRRMYTHGEAGDFYEWDMATRSCVTKIYDSCQSGSSIAASPMNNILATGCESGSVSIYKLPLNSNVQKPEKILQPLSTSVDLLKFNCTGAILAAASKRAMNAVKLIHVETMSAFINFPVNAASIRSPTLFDFSPLSGYVTVGSGPVAHLYRLKHYGNY